jgi:6-phosphofructokinase 1
MVVEVMGRHAGWIALHAGLAGTADVILIPEIPYEAEAVARKVRQRHAEGRHFTIVVVAEGAFPTGGAPSVVGRELGAKERLGGAGERLARELQERTGQETRCIVLGHLLRGGTPTATDRLISLRFGAAAVRALELGQSGIMVALDPPEVRFLPLAQCTRRMKCVPIDGDTVQTCRDLGVSFGDEPVPAELVPVEVA